MPCAGCATLGVLYWSTLVSWAWGVLRYTGASGTLVLPVMASWATAGGLTATAGGFPVVIAVTNDVRQRFVDRQSNVPAFGFIETNSLSEAQDHAANA